MAPRTALHISFYKHWMQRLEDCCKFCGELHDNLAKTNFNEVGTVKMTHDNFKETDDIQHHNTRSQNEKDDKVSIIWRPYEERDLPEKSKTKTNSFKNKHTRVSSYSRTEIRHFTPTLRHMFESRDQIEFIHYTSTDSEENDEDEDLLEELKDAFSLQHRNENNENTFPEQAQI